MRVQLYLAMNRVDLAKFVYTITTYHALLVTLSLSLSLL